MKKLYPSLVASSLFLAALPVASANTPTQASATRPGLAPPSAQSAAARQATQAAAPSANAASHAPRAVLGRSANRPSDAAHDRSIASRIQSGRSSMESFIRSGRDTPPMQVMSNSPHARLTQFEYFNYRPNEVTPKYRVTSLGTTGELDLVMLMPVSGHVSPQATEQYARTNQYNIVITHADGSVQRLPRVASTGLVTDAEVSLALKPGKTVVQFYPDGSAGVGGYRSGREIELHWDGN